MNRLTAILFSIILVISTSSCAKRSDYNDNNINSYESPPPLKEDLTYINEEDIYIENIVSNMNLKEKVGQLAIIGFQEKFLNKDTIDFITNDKIGGFILFKRNFENIKELYDLNVELKNNNINNPLPLFISIDEEGKSVSRLPEDANKIPDAVDFGSIDDIKLTEKAGAIIGEELYAMGINMNFAPVLDIPVLKNNTLLKRRAYGKEPSIVSRHGIAFINGLSSQNIISVAKHFPGHGGSNMDSHKTLPLLDAEYSLIKNRELIPFKNAIKEGIDAVMLGHLAFPKIDDSGLPASRSKVFITEILRESLGFEGITVTDDIEMYGFLGNNKNIDELIVEAFNSGIDIFLISHTKKLQKDVLDALYDGVKKGHITKERLDESLKRIIKIKLKYFLSNEMNMDFDKAYGILTDKNNKSLFENIK